ncbi:cupin domain-containing protein [Variovorax sp. Sphag1AA]|uniref:cupin domain-containing protein n=1 Tax=Variovorax sp. Sphag1AA TaxID=2587027 RepID=UPI001621E267|nr:cupin domain-containing protein [Variovorax sp. Sphag1AA]MBB3178740.1 mannose-6-phosphate isomerase-like protein (cupin superfamily) [Variovorax sp. Sphag1AA]
MSAVLHPPAIKTRVPMSEKAMQTWTSRYPDYRAPADAPALAHASTVSSLWNMRLVPMLSPQGSAGRFSQAALSCPERACTGFGELAAGAVTRAYRNTDAIENILCLEGKLKVRVGPKLERSITLERFDMVSVPVDVRHAIENTGGVPGRMVICLNGPTGSTWPAVFDQVAGLPAEALTALSVSFDAAAGLALEDGEIEGRVTRGEQLVAYKRELSASSGIPPQATEMLSAGSVYPLIVPVGHSGRARKAPMYGLPSLYLSIAECTPGEAGPPPHSHSDTQESFLCIEGEWEMTTGFHHEHVTKVKPYDIVAMPTKVMRGFRNTGPGRSRLFVVIQGAEQMTDMVAFPKRVGVEMEKRFGPQVIKDFEKIHLIFDAEDRVEAA